MIQCYFAVTYSLKIYNINGTLIYAIWILKAISFLFISFLRPLCDQSILIRSILPFIFILWAFKSRFINQTWFLVPSTSFSIGELSSEILINILSIVVNVIQDNRDKLKGLCWYLDIDSGAKVQSRGSIPGSIPGRMIVCSSVRSIIAFDLWMQVQRTTKTIAVSSDQGKSWLFVHPSLGATGEHWMFYFG